MAIFLTFVRRFYRCLLHVYPVIGLLLSLIVLLAWAFSILEGTSLFKAIYFSLVTALAIGYGDIVPATAAGKVISLLLGLIGMVLFGIVVGISTRTIMLIMHPEEVRKGERNV